MIAYNVGFSIAQKLVEWDLDYSENACILEAKKEWNFDEQDWREFRDGVSEATKGLPKPIVEDGEIEW